MNLLTTTMAAAGLLLAGYALPATAMDGMGDDHGMMKSDKMMHEDMKDSDKSMHGDMNEQDKMMKDHGMTDREKKKPEKKESHRMRSY